MDNNNPNIENKTESISNEFIEWITGDGLEVDIYSGIKELYQAIQKKNDTLLADSAYVKTGMKFIRRQVEYYLGQHYADNFMVEYSLVASTLDPDSPDKLQCCSFVSTKDEKKSGFIHRISREYSKCIDQISKDVGYSIYQHPHFLYDIKTNDNDCWEGYTKANGTQMFQSKYILTKEPLEDKKTVEDEKPAEALEDNIGESYMEKESNFAIGVFTLKRKYSEMIGVAQDLTKQEPSNLVQKMPLKDLQQKLHQACFDNISRDRAKSSYYISFPVYGARASNQLAQFRVGKGKPLQGIGACFIYFEPKDSIDSDLLKDNNFHKRMSQLVFVIGDTIRFISSNYLFNLGLQLQKRANTEAIKSAKAAIMSRNLSHNLGSHVMSYLKQSLKSVTDMERSGALEEVSTKGHKLPPIEVMEGKETKTKDPELPFLVGTGRFISYLQERQDYIATVSTDYIPFPSVVNFKDGIYDELNPDYRYLRHTEWAGHKPANILLENIARSEGLSRQSNRNQKGSNIVIKYRSFDGLNVGAFEKLDQDDINNDYARLRNWDFSLPGGIMGRQAVFSIVENVIRNAAKHGVRKAGDDLVVTFDIIDPNGKDGLSGFDEEFQKRYSKTKKPDYNRYSRDIDDLFIVTLTTNTKVNDSDTLQKIRNAIHESLVDDSGNLKQSNKGIKEMLISAAWLRHIRIEELDECDRFKIAPILRVYKQEGTDYLQYVFCLPRVKEVALIVKDNDNLKIPNKTEEPSLLQKKGNRQWITNGWYIYTLEEYKALKNKSFSFVILDKDLADKKEEVRKCSTHRFFIEADETNLQEQKIQFSMGDCLRFSKKDDFTDAVLQLFKQLANEDDRFAIAVSDKSLEHVVENTHVVDIQKLSSTEDRLREFQYIYRTHNDTKSEFEKFVKDYGDISKLCFIEGITGGNSTDRLIRHTVIDDLWAYKHVHAMKTKVAIFDERMFSNVTGIELSRIQSEVQSWEELLKDMTDEEARTYVNRYDYYRRNMISGDADFSKIYKQYTKQEVIQFAKRNYSIGEFPVETITPLVFQKKGIDLYTMTRDSDGVLIWGVCASEKTGSDIINSKDYGKVQPIGRMDFQRDAKGITPHLEMFKQISSSPIPEYDYVCLHQGLLDKVYESYEKTGDSKESRKEVTKELCDTYLKVKSNDNDFIQGLIIHSGRSKPNTDDMPQNQPFLQYSAIENALFDCKYTLVEALDHACFENHHKDEE